MAGKKARGRVGHKTKYATYKTSGRREKNKAEKLARHVLANPADKAAAQALAKGGTVAANTGRKTTKVEASGITMVGTKTLNNGRVVPQYALTGLDYVNVPGYVSNTMLKAKVSFRLKDRLNPASLEAVDNYLKYCAAA